MRKFLFVMVMLFCSALSAQKVELIKMKSLDQIIDKPSDQVKVINFWASWCGPCIKEMPHFDALTREQKANVIFVSLDFPEDLDKAERMVSKKDISSPTYLLDEKDYDAYIPKIDKSWSGAIPATLFVTPSGKKYFYEQAFEQAELEEVVKNLTSK
ncbi:MAG: TlpA disulfide reductase family protein [Cyclobacteriaceae bacterium]